MKTARFLLLLLCFALSLTACPTLITPPQATPIQAAGTWQHPGSGLSFPERISAFTRAGIHQFERPGSTPSVGVAYNCETSSATVAFTVFVSPPLEQTDGQPAPLKGQFERAQNEIREHHPGATKVWSRSEQLERDNMLLAGFAAEYRYTGEFARQVQPLISQLHVFESGEWFVKYRITFAAVQETGARAAVDALLHAVPWGALPDAGSQGDERLRQER